MQHTNITQYIESFIGGDKLYIIMEYADGGDLSAYIKKQKDAGRSFMEEDVMRIFVQICLVYLNYFYHLHMLIYILLQ
jgi:serine/threonine protein kinase